MMRATIALLVLSLGASAQNPAPAAEGKAVWTAEEAQAFACVQQLASAWREGRECEPRCLNQIGAWSDYSAVRVDWRSGEAVLMSARDARRMGRPGRCVVYLAPSKYGSKSRRAFCVRGDGVAAFTDNSKELSLTGEHRFAADAVFGAGGNGDLTEFPRTPARGRDGNLWQPTNMLRQVTVNVMVVDDTEQPMPMWSVACLPAEPEYAVEHALPAGRLLTTLEGSAKLTGMPARGLGIALFDGRHAHFWIAKQNVTVRGGAVRITVSRDLLRRWRMNANESAAIATLKNISSAQSQCQASGVIDGNQDGRGEYGMFAELAGRGKLRGTELCMTPPVLSAAFGNIDGGVVSRSGYCFRMLLPGKDAEPVPEDAAGGVKPAAIDAAKAEVYWGCYAWPVDAGTSGQRVFFINQTGTVLVAPNTEGAYSGRDKGPSATAAYADTGGMAAAVAVNRQGVDKQAWQVIH